MPTANDRKKRFKNLVRQYEDTYVEDKAKGPLPRSEHTPVNQQRRNMGLPEITNDERILAQEKARKRVVGTAPRFADGGKVRGDGICQRGKTKGRMV